MSRQASEWQRRVGSALCRLESSAVTLEHTDPYAFARRVVNAGLEGWNEPFVYATYMGLRSPRQT
jgi:hypothetical protein